jgi:hypothetical protein
VVVVAKRSCGFLLQCHRAFVLYFSPALLILPLQFPITVSPLLREKKRKEPPGHGRKFSVVELQCWLGCTILCTCCIYTGTSKWQASDQGWHFTSYI